MILSNCNDDKINDLRDLEDFTRVHMVVDPRIVAIPGVTYWLKFDKITWGNPSANLFQAEKPTMAYLEVLDTANKQLQKRYKVHVGSTEAHLPSQFIQSDGQVSPFLLEGQSPGKGSLTLIARLGGMEVSRDAVELELREPSEFVEKYKVDAVAPGSDQVQPQAAPENPPCAYTPESDEYVLYVHGWNMAGWEKDRWLEMVFKRLWWLGYKGRVGGFRWPTLEGTLTYDQSEFRAWRSGQALAGLLENLNGQHPGKVRVIAHSMGNVVMGEALRKLTQPVVHSYLAAQAAIPAHMYDASIPVQEVWGPFVTPDIYRHYFDGKLGEPYLARNVDKVLHPIIQYFNPEDYALNYWWEKNNKDKPDNNTKGYNYEDHDGDMDTYHPDPYNPGQGDWFHSLAATLTLPKDTFEVFAFCVQSRSWALGKVGKDTQIQGFGIHRNLEKWGYNDTHYSHSREFRSNIVREGPFWKSVAEDFNLKINQPQE